MAGNQGKFHIGISGWRYTPWRKIFYPEDLPQNQELHFASRQVNSIEINGSFYSLQTPESYKKWYADTPADFQFSVKGPRYVTHIKRLKDVEKPLANFFGSGVLHLQEKLGPILWQFPPNFGFTDDRVEEFLKMLPQDFKSAVKLAKKADRVAPDFPKGAAQSTQRIRHAMEIRNHSFENPMFIELLRQYNVALVFADTAGRWPYMEDLTSDFIYLRLHGDEELYASGYGAPTLKWWSDRAAKWNKGGEPADALKIGDGKHSRQPRDIYCFFDNDIKVHAPFDAQTLMKFLKVDKPRS